MSMSIESLGQRLYFAAVPLSLILGIAIAFWIALSGAPERSTRKVSLPFFEYQAPEETPTPLAPPSRQLAVPPPRDIFQFDAPSKTVNQSLDLHEISLGLVIVKGEKKYCLTNGGRYTIGEGNMDFTVLRIDSNGVWYQIGTEEIYLQPGEKVNVDGNGTIGK